MLNYQWRNARTSHKSNVCFCMCIFMNSSWKLNQWHWILNRENEESFWDRNFGDSKEAEQTEFEQALYHRFGHNNCIKSIVDDVILAGMQRVLNFYFYWFSTYLFVSSIHTDEDESESKGKVKRDKFLRFVKYFPPFSICVDKVITNFFYHFWIVKYWTNHFIFIIF